MDRPTTWPDGRKLGGENGYSPEWHQWAEECQVKYVARQMLKVPQERRRNVHTKWARVFPHATPEAVKAVWDEVVAERMRNKQGNKTQQLRNNATKTQQQRNGEQ